MGQDVKAVCKKCGKMAPASSFVLSSTLRMMVCPNCAKIGKESIEKQQQKEMEASKKPAGWDSEDDYLERAFKEKSKDAAYVEKIDDTKVRYTCPKCRYKFVYDTIRKYPASCGYCGTKVQNLMIR